MQYFVIAPDGSRYGPADVALLQQWATENRVTPLTMLEEEGTGRRMPASSVGGIFPQPMPGQYPMQGQYPVMNPEQGMPPGSMYAQPPNLAMYPRASYDTGSSQVTTAFVLFGCGAFFCILSPILCAFGLAQANKAIQMGHPSGSVARILNLILLILGSLVWLFYLVAIIIGISGGFN